PYMQQTAELVQAMWTEVGFKVRFNLYDEVALQQKRRERDFHADSSAASYRWDPDGWFSPYILSTAPTTKIYSVSPTTGLTNSLPKRAEQQTARNAWSCTRPSTALSTRNCPSSTSSI